MKRKKERGKVKEREDDSSKDKEQIKIKKITKEK